MDQIPFPLSSVSLSILDLGIPAADLARVLAGVAVVLHAGPSHILLKLSDIPVNEGMLTVSARADGQGLPRVMGRKTV